MDKYVPKVMFYNTEKGVPMPGEHHKNPAAREMSQTGMSIPVEVLFNENSTCGEVTPLKSGTVQYSEGGRPGTLEFQAGENIVLGHVQLSARPRLADMALADEYADRLVVPKGQENYVRPEGIKATQAVLASGEMALKMEPWDGARLERHLAYGDVNYEREPHTPLNVQDMVNKGMVNTGKILCGDPNKIPVNGETLFDLDKAASGTFTGEEIRQQYRNGGTELGRVPGAYRDADKFLTTEFKEFMDNAPQGKPAFAKGLAEQWSKLDELMKPGNGRGAAAMGMMHVACSQMGWDLLPELDDAVKMRDALKDYQNGNTEEFEKLVEKSLTEHPQPEREYPGREQPKQPEPEADAPRAGKPSKYAQMQAQMAEADRRRAHDDYDYEP